MKNKHHFPIVIVIDDGPEDRLLLKQAFEECRENIKVHLFDCGDDLLGFLKSSVYEGSENFPDLIVAHVRMPENGCIEVVGKLKADPKFRQIPLIVLLDSTAESEVKNCYERGANTVINRPRSAEEMVRVLKKTCDYWFGILKM